MRQEFSRSRSRKSLAGLGDPDIERLLIENMMVTQTVDKGELPNLRKVAEQTGYEVDVLEDRPGGSYPFLRQGGGRELSYQRVGEGRIAIGVRRPSKEKDYSTFWENVRADEQNRARTSRRVS